MSLQQANKRAFGREIRKDVNQISPGSQLNKLANKLEAGAVLKPANATSQGSPIAGAAASATAAPGQTAKVQHRLAPTETGYSCDKAGKDSHLHSLQYLNRIMNHMFDTECDQLPRADYLETIQQADTIPTASRVHKKMRTILLNWITEVHEKFGLRHETLFLTANLMDRFLSIQAIPREKLQLVGCTAMWISCKYHEIYSPSIRDFTYISDKAFTSRQMVSCEERMVKALNFQLTVPNPLSFLSRFCRVCTGVMGSSAVRINHLANYLLERCLLDYKMLAFKPSMLAASCLYAAVSLTSGGEWHHELERATRYSKADLKLCVEQTRRYILVNDPKLNAKHKSVVHKYSKEKNGSVAKLRPRRRY